MLKYVLLKLNYLLGFLRFFFYFDWLRIEIWESSRHTYGTAAYSVLHQLLPPVKCTQYNLRNRPHNYTLPKVNNNYIKTILCSECYTKTFINLTNYSYSLTVISVILNTVAYICIRLFSFWCEIGAFVTYVIKRYLLTYLLSGKLAYIWRAGRLKVRLHSALYMEVAYYIYNLYIYYGKGKLWQAAYA